MRASCFLSAHAHLVRYAANHCRFLDGVDEPVAPPFPNGDITTLAFLEFFREMLLIGPCGSESARHLGLRKRYPP